MKSTLAFFVFCAFGLVVKGADDKRFKINFPFSSEKPLNYEKFDPDNLLKQMTRTFTWILYNLRIELDSLIPSLMWMLRPDIQAKHSKEMFDLGTMMMDAVIDNILGPKSIIKLSGDERKLLTGFLL